jgi:predicted nucleic acid-binding protein
MSTRGTPIVALLDTNVLLDAILTREPWFLESVALLEAASRRQIRAAVAGHSVTTIYYLVAKSVDDAAARMAVSDLLQILDVVALDRDDFQRALAMGLKDFEDAVQAAAALKIGADVLVTRNPKDFKGASVTLRSAGETVAMLSTRRR